MPYGQGMTRNIADSTGPEALTPRDINRLAVMELVFSNPGIVRSAVQERTGLSRATIFRILDELTSDGYLSETPRAGGRSRGRPKLELSVSPTMGQVLGADIGALTTRMMVSDLNGFILARRQLITPTGLTPANLADWFGSGVEDLLRETQDYGTLLRAVVSLPAKIDSEGIITRPAGHLKALEHVDFRLLTETRLGVPTELRSDPDMALLGEMKIGQASGYQDVVMLVVSTSVRGSIAIGGEVLGGDRRLIGEYGALPIGDGRSLSDVLTLSGIREAAQKAGVALGEPSTLLVGVDSGFAATIRRDAEVGLAAMLSSIILNVDPRIVVVTGSLLPLISEILPSVKSELLKRLPSLPTIALSQTGGFSQPRGAVEVALQAARSALRESVLTRP